MERWHRVALREAFAYHYHLDQADAHRHNVEAEFTALTVHLARGLEDIGMTTPETQEVTTWVDVLAVTGHDREATADPAPEVRAV